MVPSLKLEQHRLLALEDPIQFPLCWPRAQLTQWGTWMERFLNGRPHLLILGTVVWPALIRLMGHRGLEKAKGAAQRKGIDGRREFI